jgi:hypothetical protein
LPSGEIQFIHPKDGFSRKSERRKSCCWETNSRLGKIQIQLLLNLLGQVPLIRKVSNFPLKFTSPKKETSKEKKKEGK